MQAGEFEEGIKGLRKQFRISSDLVCTASLICLYYKWPQSFLTCMNSFLSSSDQIGRERVVGWVKGKESNKPVCAKVRCVLPLNALLSICDIVLATKLNHHIDMLLPPDFNVYVGARPETQCADIAFACHLVIEKSLDDQGRGALAQSDISQYYDNLPVIKVLEWCGHKGVDHSFLLAIGRLQLCCCVCVRVGASEAVIPDRVVGGLTGSRLAGSLARIPAEESASHINSCIKRHGYKVGNQRIGLALWVDNCFSFGNCLEGAIEIQEAFESRLVGEWDLGVKPSSRMCFRPAASCEVPPLPSKWPIVGTYPVLGHVISPSGAVRPAWDITIKQMWKCFFSNFGRGKVRGVPDKHKIELLKRAVRPSLTFRCSIWPPQKTIGRELDCLQRKMLSLICLVRRQTGESQAQHALRRGRHVSRLIGPSELWSKHWYVRSGLWDEHVRRGHTCKWNQKILSFNNVDWLQNQRIQFASEFTSRVRGLTMFAGRTGTRASAAKVLPRREESIRWSKNPS